LQRLPERRACGTAGRKKREEGKPVGVVHRDSSSIAGWCNSGHGRCGAQRGGRRDACCSASGSRRLGCADRIADADAKFVEGSKDVCMAAQEARDEDAEQQDYERHDHD
jgi:hypothetical protein